MDDNRGFRNPFIDHLFKRRMEINQFKAIIKQIEEDSEELVELNLANSSLDDFLIGDLCSALSHNSHISKLDLTNNSFSSEGLQHFIEFGNRSCPLIELNLSMNNLSGESLRWIAITVSNSNIQHLSVDNANIGRADISNLCSLTHDSHLVTLSMNNNSIGDDGFSTLLSYLHEIPTLQKLYLQNNGITNHSINSISHFVSTNSSIQLIDIQGELIGKEECEVLHSIRDSCQILFTQPREMEIVQTNHDSIMINSFDMFQQDQIDLYTHYYIIMLSLYNQLRQWKHIDTLPTLQFNSKLVGGDVTNSLITNQTLIANEFHIIRDQMIDLKESFYAVQNSPEYQISETAIRLITDNILVIIQALTLPAYFVSAENNVHFSLENSLVNTAGTIHRCGKLRIELILLLATMINRGYPTVIQAMIDNRIIDLVLTMFDDYPWNSVLHNAMGVLLTEIIESKSLELVHSALVDCNLYCRMKRQILSELLSRKKGESTSSGYLGVLHNVCCVIEATAKQNPEVEQALQLMESQQTYTEEENKLFDEMKDMNKEEEVYTADFDYYDFSTV